MATSTSTGPGRPPPRWLLKAITRAHLWLHRLSGGRLFNKLGGVEMCFVEMEGARSGRRLTLPLLHVPFREGRVLVASQGGAPTHPGWYYNLLKNPDLVVTHRGRRVSLRARVASDEEKLELWPLCERVYPPFGDYQKRTTRDIPIFVCEPPL